MSSFCCKLSKGCKRTVILQRQRLKTGVIFAMLAISFIFVGSLFQEARASTQPSTPTPGSAVTPELTPASNGTIEFGYPVIGKEYSNMPAAETITLCNYLTPPHYGNITKISIYLTGISGISNVRAMIFANEPEANFPKGGEPIAQSFETLNVTTASQWYNFTMDCPVAPNTVYWLGYYSDSPTHYFFDASNDSMTVTSQPKDGTSSWLPVGWSYQTTTIMSLSALYTYADPSSAATHTQSTLSYGDAAFVFFIIGGETAILVTGQTGKKIIPNDGNA
jgi:hypothetical protein